MGAIKIIGRRLKGDVNIPSSKSLCHRAIICAGLSENESVLSNITFSKDIEVTCKAISALGAVVNINNNVISIKSSLLKRTSDKPVEIDCHESGSSLRFFIPIAAAMGVNTVFRGTGKLVERPLNSYYEIFDKQSFEYSNNNGKLPLIINGKLKPGEFMVDGNVSSQFISGLLMSLPLLSGDSKIILTSKLESKPYVDLTIETLKVYGIKIINNDYREFIINGNQKFINSNYFVEGDFSQAAFWLTANYIGSNINCKGLNLDTSQGDKQIISLLECLKFDKKVITIDATEIPDIVPILTVAATLSDKTVKIINAGRLRFKESDRLLAISTELNKIGADIKLIEDGLLIQGKSSLVGGTVDSWNDHRIAMSLAIAATRCVEPVVINNYEAVNKSYPDFFKDYKNLGGVVNECSMGN